MSDLRIAAECKVDRATVYRLRRDLEANGYEQAAIDGRVRSGRRAKFDKAYERLRALKQANPESGGRDLWVMLTSDEGWAYSAVPTVGAIDKFLSEEGLTQKTTSRKNVRAGFWLTDKVETVNDRVGMDEVLAFHLKNGLQIKVVDLRDWHSGITYAEPYPTAFHRADQRGLTSLEFARVFMMYRNHCGTPRSLVLDNGGGQILSGGWLPEVCRYAISCNTVVEWEPYAEPTQNSPVERWHRELRKRWRRDLADIRSLSQACEWVRRQALLETTVYPRYNLGDRPPSSVFPVRPWETADGRSSLPSISEIGHGGCVQDGMIRMHRRVEANGVIQLHGGELIRVSDMLTGCKVRVDFHIPAGGQPGEGNVIEAHGQVVMSFRHRVECGIGRNDRLCYDFKEFAYQGGEDSRNAVWSQEAYDDKTRKAHKADRSKQFVARRNAIAKEVSE